jgi:hypothetical protein
MYPVSVPLDPTLHSDEVLEIRKKLLSMTIGQDHAVESFCSILETFYAGYNDPAKPVGVVLELGPTGVGLSVLPHTKALARARPGPGPGLRTAPGALLPAAGNGPGTRLENPAPGHRSLLPGYPGGIPGFACPVISAIAALQDPG